MNVHVQIFGGQHRDPNPDRDASSLSSLRLYVHDNLKRLSPDSPRGSH